ncbi:MAG: hypothetical protein LUG27_07495 [Clostridiales bacterium]|nr:hypothetical protein [Lachnospiraceae bacterium]MCD7922262.1 hypothetical protein [Clostridiales bacterium]MCD8134074.1 hypothetical protein [Clostridiales bacterium]
MLADTMKRVQDAEQQAAGILQDAKSKAAAMLDEARAAAKQTVKEAENSADEAAKSYLAGVVKTGEAEKEKYASSVNRELEASGKQAYAKADAAVEALIAGLV